MLHGVKDGHPGNAIAQDIGAQEASQKRKEMPGHQAQLPAEIWGHPTPPWLRANGSGGGEGFARRKSNLYIVYRLLFRPRRQPSRSPIQAAEPAGQRHSLH
jgi:hypothetical protein